MLAFRPFLNWVSRHILVFVFSPISFALTGLLVGILASQENDLINNRLQGIYNQALLLMGPWITGGFLGVLSSGLQVVVLPARKKLPQFQPMRWILFGSIGMAFAFLAFAWGYNAHLPVNKLFLASLFSAAVYGLTASLPQSRLLGSSIKNTWYWLLSSTMSALFSFPLICSPVWIAEGPGYFWLIFPLSALGGTLMGLVTWVPFTR